MARYKVLKSVAHNIVHSFSSDMNYRDGDFVLSHLLKEMVRSGSDTLHVNLLTGHADPDILLVSPVRSSIDSYVKRLSDLVASHQTSMAFVRTAEMTVTFDLAKSRPMRVARESIEYPFIGRAIITDDRGKAWTGEVRDWWSPDAGEPVTVPGGQRITVRRSFGQLIQSIWQRSRKRRE